MEKPVIGFIGLGLMGGNMAECLLKNGFELNVMGRNKEAVAAATALGANELGTPKEIAQKSDIVMLCVTTSDATSTQKIGADLAAKGAGMIDAPLGRTPTHAKDGLLNIMAAGDKETFEKVIPVLDVQGENVFYLGAS